MANFATTALLNALAGGKNSFGVAPIKGFGGITQAPAMGGMQGGGSGSFFHPSMPGIPSPNPASDPLLTKNNPDSWFTTFGKPVNDYLRDKMVNSWVPPTFEKEQSMAQNQELFGTPEKPGVLKGIIPDSMLAAGQRMLGTNPRFDVSGLGALGLGLEEQRAKNAKLAAEEELRRMQARKAEEEAKWKANQPVKGAGGGKGGGKKKKSGGTGVPEPPKWGRSTPGGGRID